MTIEETDATVSTPATELLVFGDENQLVQLFQNLVGNGIKYNSDPREIDVSITRQDERVTVAVTDNGIGMQPDQTDDIFEVFNRLHTREEFDGTGVGLSICRKIVERHGGEISVESEPDDGSTFTVVLPLGDDHDV
jgi:signal transduction histidine kinase